MKIFTTVHFQDKIKPTSLLCPGSSGPKVKYENMGSRRRAGYFTSILQLANPTAKWNERRASKRLRSEMKLALFTKSSGEKLRCTI